MALNETIIPFSKRKLTRLLLLCLIFIAIGISFIIVTPGSGPIMSNPVLKTIIGCLSLLFGLACGIFYVAGFFKKHPRLIIDDTGFTHYSRTISAGFLPWTDVKSVAPARVGKQQLLIVLLKDNQSYLDRQPNALKRKAMEFNCRNYGSPVVISVNALRCSFDEALQLFRSALNRAYRPR